MLKPTLVVGLVLLQCVSSFINLDPDNYKCLDVINSLRRDYAYKHRIANMNELTYDKYYEATTFDYLHSFRNWECPVPTIHFIHEYAIFSDVNSDPYALNLLASGNDITNISCYKHKCEETGKDVLSVFVRRRFSFPRKGPAGSDCGGDNRHNNDGLCSSTPPQAKYGRKGFFDDLPSIGGYPDYPSNPIEIPEDDVRILDRVNTGSINRPNYKYRNPADSEARANGFRKISRKTAISNPRDEALRISVGGLSDRIGAKLSREEVEEAIESIENTVMNLFGPKPNPNDPSNEEKEKDYGKK